MEEKDNIDEIQDEIDSALKDARGITSHQKRLAFCLSIGIADILEKYLKSKNALKPEYKINHQWLKKSKQNIKEILADKTTFPLSQLSKLDKIIDIAYEIESKRNELAYGKQTSEKILRNLINKFLEIKREVENE